jgi:hypothetical protein
MMAEDDVGGSMCEALFARLSKFLLGDELGVLICMWQRSAVGPRAGADALPLNKGWEG